MAGTHKRDELEARILDTLSGDALSAAELLFYDKETLALQEHANVVSIRRLGMNDHGPVHMRIAALNSLRMLELLVSAGVGLNLEAEAGLSADDSRIAVFLGAMLHDIGMSVERDCHEEYGLLLSMPIIDRVLGGVIGEETGRFVAVRSAALEGIAGHMAGRRVSSMEAGLVLIGDGCDMEHGRSRITRKLSMGPQIGDIHRYSADAVDRVDIRKGEERPIRIEITLRENAGFFQVEKVLFPKIDISPVKPFIELVAGTRGGALLRYL